MTGVLVGSQNIGAEFANYPGRIIPPLVSSHWLYENLSLSNLVIIDIRSNEEYLKGHIPNAVNVPFALPNSAWAITKGGLMLEIPSKESLFETIGSIGIKSDSLVVVVGKTGHPFPLADAARVATTLLYAGLKNVSILDGGYEKWVNEKRPLSTDVVSPSKTTYEGATNDAILVSKEYVLQKVNSKDKQSVIVDARDPDVYFGVTVEPWAPTPGHIPGAKNLPAPWLWIKNQIYRDVETLEAMASGVVGDDKSKEIIVYCGVGGYASALWFVLKEILGYANVKLYDGSWQEWARRKPSGPIALYVWE